MRKVIVGAIIVGLTKICASSRGNTDGSNLLQYEKVLRVRRLYRFFYARVMKGVREFLVEG